MTPYYAQKLEEGLAYQDYVIELLYEAGLPVISYASKKYQHTVGENRAGLEIKNDQMFRKTGNLYIETAEKSNANNAEYVPSGIFRNDNTWLYLIGDAQEVFVLSKKQLRLVKDKYKQATTPTSKGFLLPVEEARRFLAVNILQPEVEAKGQKAG
jgi:hypothetical protein